MTNKYLTWLNETPLFHEKNGEIVFSNSSIKSFVHSFKEKIELENDICIDVQEEKELEKLFIDLFIKEASNERGVVGNYSISLSKKNVYSIIIAIAGVVDMLATGINIHSGAISGISLVYALGSTISKLTKEELKLIGNVLLLRNTNDEVISIETVLKKFNDYDEVNLLNLLNSLVYKDAIEWDGGKDSKIKIKKWM